MIFDIEKLPHYPDHDLPAYETSGSSGLDLRAAIPAAITLNPMERATIPTGLKMAIAAGYEGQVRPRSGLSSKKGITVINAPGTIDSDYRGEVKIPIVNLDLNPVSITPGMRIAQLVICPVAHITWNEVKSISLTARNTGGFGSTGTH
jgi:dUTP pyrophosphatase